MHLTFKEMYIYFFVFLTDIVVNRVWISKIASVLPGILELFEAQWRRGQKSSDRVAQVSLSISSLRHLSFPSKLGNETLRAPSQAEYLTGTYAV